MYASSRGCTSSRASVSIAGHPSFSFICIDLPGNLLHRCALVAQLVLAVAQFSSYGSCRLLFVLRSFMEIFCACRLLRREPARSHSGLVLHVRSPARCLLFPSRPGFPLHLGMPCTFRHRSPACYRSLLLVERVLVVRRCRIFKRSGSRSNAGALPAPFLVRI